MKNKIILHFTAFFMAIVLGISCVYATNSTPAQQITAIVEATNAHGLLTEQSPISEQKLNAMLSQVEQGASVYYVANTVLAELDDYSMYLSDAQYTTSYSSITGYTGIGVTLQHTSQGALIVDVLPQSPADQAGISCGDIITQVNGVTITGLSLDEIVNAIVGQPNTGVAITVLQDDVSTEYWLVRATMQQSTLRILSFDDTVYYSLSSFTNESDIDRLYNDWTTNTASNVVLDLRNNGGGALNYAMHVINAFISTPQKHIATLHWREDVGGTEFVQADGNGKTPNHLIILVNENTASAAEMCAGSLRDCVDAVLVGDSTYGKSMGQRHIQLKVGGSLIVTCLAIELPISGSWESVGLTPTYSITKQALLSHEFCQSSLFGNVTGLTAGHNICAYSALLAVYTGLS